MLEVWEGKTYKLTELTDTWRISVNVETIIKVQLSKVKKKTTIEIVFEASDIANASFLCVLYNDY